MYKYILRYTLNFVKMVNLSTDKTLEQSINADKKVIKRFIELWKWKFISNVTNWAIFLIGLYMIVRIIRYLIYG